MSPAFLFPRGYRMIGAVHRFRIAVLLVSLILIAAAPALAADPGSLTVWKDTCAIFEQDNETAYTEDANAPFAPIAANITPPADSTNSTWSNAFLSLHSLMKERYAFSQLKNIDWNKLYATWEPAVKAAENAQDKAAYYRAIRGYLYAIPDGHVNVLPNEGDFGAKYADIGGGYGISLVQLDSGNVIVAYVANGSTAEQAGIRSGDEVTGWNGVEIHNAINATSFIWAYKKPSTEEGIRIQKTRLLTRAPVGTPAMVKITYGSIPHPRILNLIAYDDRYDTLTQGTFYLGKAINDIGTDDQLYGIRPLVSNDTVTVKTLRNGYTYVAVYEESYEVYQPFKAAMLSAIANKSPGIILDLRFNGGGDDNLAACMAGWFVDQPVFYEYGTKYDPGTKQFTVLTEAWTQPQIVRYGGPVVVMVSPDTISSGEGVPNVFVRSGTGAVVSFYGSNGAYGMNNFQASLPLGMYILFPDGASLDMHEAIQVDSNAALKGGVSPTVRVPLNEETLARAMAGEDVQLTYAMDWLDSQQAPVTIRPIATTTKKSSAGIAMVIVAVSLLVVAAKRK